MMVNLYVVKLVVSLGSEKYFAAKGKMAGAISLWHSHLFFFLILTLL